MSCEGGWGLGSCSEGKLVEERQMKDLQNVVQSAWDLLVAPGAA